jgi:HNH endonuclease
MRKEDFWSRVDVRGQDECWLWKGKVNNFGYGRIGGCRTAHRMAYQLTHGSIPEGTFILHKCDNPPCCNPSHLYAGTPADNVRDMLARNRNAKVKPNMRGEANHAAKITWEQAREMRRMKAIGMRVMQIARIFGVHWGIVSRATLGQSFNEHTN